MSLSPSAAMRRLAGFAAAVLTTAAALVIQIPPASAATTTLFASPAGTGSSCTAAQPCSLPGAQAAVRSINSSMTDDIVVQLAGGTYALSAPLTFTAADSGANGHTVIWQAAPGASGHLRRARVTGWTRGRLRPQHLAGQRRHRHRHPAAVRQRPHRHPGPDQLNRGDFTANDQRAYASPMAR